MYLFLKKGVKKVLPQKLLFKAEPLLRKAYALFFMGKKYYCTICDGSFSRFIQLRNGELICSRCGSLPRDRRLYQVLKNENFLHGRVLDFSPSRTIYRKLKTIPGIEYFASDFANEFISDYQFDISAIAKSNNFFDLIICYHILEHVEADSEAMSELIRVLKPSGSLVLQTPFREGEILEDTSIKTEEERLKNFGQKDHVRIYSIDGLSERLKKSGFRVNILRFNEQLNNRFGFSEKEIIFHCKK